jgi:hypothetical protein
MQLKTLARPSHAPIRNPNLQRRLSRPSISFNTQLSSRRLSNPIAPPSIRISPAKIRRSRLVTACVGGQSNELLEDVELEAIASESDGNSNGNGNGNGSVVGLKREELETQSIWSKMKEIMMFSGPATGLWICAPLMSLISTAVIGRGSSTELAALGRFFNLKVYKKVLNFLFGFWENLGKEAN